MSSLLQEIVHACMLGLGRWPHSMYGAVLSNKYSCTSGSELNHSWVPTYCSGVHMCVLVPGVCVDPLQKVHSWEPLRSAH